MDLRSKKWGLLGLLAAAMVGLVFGCGQPICVMNIGKCDGVNTQRTGQTGNYLFALSANPSVVVSGGTTTITATPLSGTGYPPYTFQIMSTGLQGGQISQPVPGNTCSYTAPTGTSGTAIIQGRDSQGNYSGPFNLPVTLAGQQQQQVRPQPVPPRPH